MTVRCAGRAAVAGQCEEEARAVLGHPSQIYGSFNPTWEVLGGMNVYPAPTRWFRVNLHVIARIARPSAACSATTPPGSTAG